MARDAAADARAKVPTQRVFFALDPDPPTAVALARAAAGVVEASRGRATPPHNLHMTLAFLGSLDGEGLERARQVPPIRVGPFALELDRCGYLRRARTLTLEPRVVPDALTALHERLWSGLGEAGFARERRPFRPHVTLARRAYAAKGTVEPVVWRVDRLALMESVPEADGVRYRALERWPL